MCLHLRLWKLFASGFTLRCRSRTLSLLLKNNTEFLSAVKDYSSLSTPSIVFGESGYGPGYCHNPVDIAIGKRFIYVTEEILNCVNIFQLDGQYYYTIGNKAKHLNEGSNGVTHKKLNSPFGISILEPTGEVFVSNKKSSTIIVFDEEGRYLRQFTCRHRNKKTFDCLTGIAVHNNGIIACVDTNRSQVTIFDNDGNFLNEFGKDGNDNGEFGMPEYIAIDSCNNTIVVSDTINSRIQVFNMNGEFIYKCGKAGIGWGMFDFPSGISVDNVGNIFVCDRTLHCIQVFDRHGNFVHTFGCLGSAPGMFDNPKGIDISSDNCIVVIDNDNNRIQMF